MTEHPPERILISSGTLSVNDVPYFHVFLLLLLSNSKFKLVSKHCKTGFVYTSTSIVFKIILNFNISFDVIIFSILLCLFFVRESRRDLGEKECTQLIREIEINNT